MVFGCSPVAVTSTSDMALVSSKEFLDIRAKIKCGFTLKGVRDMTITYSKMNFTDNMSFNNVIIIIISLATLMKFWSNSCGIKFI